MKTIKENIVKKDIKTEVEHMYKIYALDTIKDRAIPNVVDGLKPVQRKALYTMWEMGLNHKTTKRKVNTIAGSALKYSVHGNVSVEDSISSMAAWFKYNIPFIDGQGNFGSVFGDGPAAGRYCVTGDTRVIVRDKGALSHLELSRTASIPDIQGYMYFDNPIYVKSQYGEWLPCSKMVDSGLHPVYELTLSNGMSIRCTGNHPVKIAGMKYHDKIGDIPETIWKEAEKLTTEDMVMIDAAYSKDKQTMMISHDDIMEAKLVGALLAYKHIKTQIMNKTSAITTAQDKATVLFSSLFSIPWDSISKNSECAEISLYSIPAHNIMDKCNAIFASHGHTFDWEYDGIPGFVFEQPKKYQMIVLEYLLSSHCDVIDKGLDVAEMIIGLESHSLAQDIIWMLSSLGIENKYEVVNEPFGTVYKIIIDNIIDVKELASMIPFLTPEMSNMIQSKRVHPKSTRTSPNYIVDTWTRLTINTSSLTFSNKREFDKIFLPGSKRIVKIIDTLTQLYDSHKLVSIKSIRKLPEPERVFSLVIDHPSHAYITNGIVSHNTEARLSEYSDKVLFDDLQKGSSIIPWSLNYDDTLYEPDMLPARVPNLLINGSRRGMAVGYASQHVPHNPIDVINATIAYIKNKNITIEELSAIIKGPDFPTGGVINGLESVYKAYETGKGSVLLRGKWKVTEDRGYKTVSIYEVPFGISTPTIHAGIAKLADENKIKLVRGSLHDHSDMNGINIEFSIKKDEDIDHVMNNILKNTELETRITISAYVIDADDNLKLATLKDLIADFIEGRENMLHAKFLEEINTHNKRIHLLNGLIVISSDMDNAIAMIRKSKGKQDAKEKLMKKYKLDEAQAEYILNMAVYRLSNMEIQSIADEVKGLKKRVSELEILTKTKSNKLVDKYMIDEMESTKNTIFKDAKRRTKIQAKYDKITTDETIRDDAVTVMVTREGYIKKFIGHTIGLDADTKSTFLSDGDEVVDIIRTTETKTLVMVTDRSHIFGIKVHSLDFNKRGKLLRNVVMAKDYENILSWWEHNNGDKYDVITVSSEGMIKSTLVDDTILSPRGKLIMDVGRKGCLSATFKSTNKDIISLVTRKGQILTFKNSIRNTGSGGIGVRCIKLKPEDAVAGATILKDKIAIISEHGLYKTIGKDDLPVVERGGFGVIAFNIKDDYVVGIVSDDFERYVVRVGNSMFYDFYLGKAGKRTNKAKSIDIPTSNKVLSIINWV